MSGMISYQGRCSLLFIGLLLFAAETAAHGISLFAAAEGQELKGEVSYHGGQGAAGVKVRIQTTDGQLLAEVRTDEAGTFGYRAEAARDHLLVADTGDGHRAVLQIEAEELAAAFETGGLVSGARDADLAAVLEQALARQLRPLRRELAEARRQAGLRDILGGIGYLFGIAGLALWWRYRRGGSNR